MLDDELIDSMKYGLVLLCPDGIERCFYPRIFTYSADYPEKQVFRSHSIHGFCTNKYLCFFEQNSSGRLPEQRRMPVPSLLG